MLSRVYPPTSKDQAFLITDNWNDWSEFKTQYYLVVFNEFGKKFEIGSVKIGQFGLSGILARPGLPLSFEQLDDKTFFFLGTEEDYYNNLNEIGDATRVKLLEQLNDIAANLELYHKAKNERVLHSSLMRDISISTRMSLSTSALVNRKFKNLVSVKLAFLS